MIGIFILSLPIISASSSHSPVDDFCLTYDTTSWIFWFHWYYDIDNDETIQIKFTDPTTNQTLLMPAGYYYPSIDECLDLAYYMRDGGRGFYEDVLEFGTYNKSCNVSMQLKFDSDSTLNQWFTMYVRENQTECSNVLDAVSPSVNTSLGGGLYLESQTVYDGFVNVWSGGNTRACQKKFIPNMTIHNITFYLSESDSPSGTMNASIRKVSDDSVIAFDTLDVDSGPDITFEFDPAPLVNEEVYLCFEYNGPSRMEAKLKLSDVKSGESYYSYNTGSYYSYAYDLWYYLHWSNYTENSLGSSPEFSAIPDIYMNSGENFTLDINSSLDYWEELFVVVKDPFADYYYTLPTGYHTINHDYYDLVLHTNGSLKIIPYDRPYNFDILLRACNTTPVLSCVEKSVPVFINSTLGNVTQLDSFEAYYQLGFTGHKFMYMNQFFKYYDTFVLSFPDSNMTGILNGGAYNYTLIENPSLNASYLVYLSCDIRSDYYEVNLPADLNITMGCGNNNVWFEFYPNNNYNQRVYFTA
jgi:hypothetical protein